MHLKSTRFFIHPLGGVAPTSVVITPSLCQSQGSQSALQDRLAHASPSGRPALTTTAGSDPGLASELMSDM